MLRSLILLTTFLLASCVNTEGTLELKGKVLDEYTNQNIPEREIIVRGLIENDNKLMPIDAGQFSTDSNGCFIYSLKKIRNVRYYDFFLVGDSDYSFMTNKIHLTQLTQNAKFLFFSLSKLVGLTIKIQKTNKTLLRDTLYLTLESNKLDLSTLYPYEVENNGITNNSFGYIPGLGLRWIGGNISSTVRARVFADKLTKIHWELVRDKKRNGITDTITCRRDIPHVIYFTY